LGVAVKQIRKRVTVFLAAFSSIVALGIFAGGPASAQQTQICGNNGTGYCMNDWNGKDFGPVDMYYGGSSHEDFIAQGIDRCNGYVVTMTCPFQDSDLDSEYYGDPIVQIEYVPSGECLSGVDGASGYLQVVLDYCNNVGTGSGGGYGTVYIIDKYQELISRYYSDQTNSANGLESGGGPGRSLSDNYSCGGFTLDYCTDWGGL
jgi:hypothetical protein